MALKDDLAKLRNGSGAASPAAQAAPAAGSNPFARVASGAPASPAPAAQSAAPARPNPFASPTGNAPPPAPPNVEIPGGKVNPPERDEPPEEAATDDPSEPAEAGAPAAGKRGSGRPRGSKNAAPVVESSPELTSALVGLVLALTELAKAATKRLG